jgi:hypothetical protein
MQASEEPRSELIEGMERENTPKQEDSTHVRHDISEDAYERASDLLTGDSLFPLIFYDDAKSGQREHESDLCRLLKEIGFTTQEIYGIMVNFYSGEKWKGRNKNLGYGAKARATSLRSGHEHKRLAASDSANVHRRLMHDHKLLAQFQRQSFWWG